MTRAKVIFPVIASLLCGACALPAYRAHPNLHQRASAIKTVYLTQPRIDVVSIGAGNTKEKIDDWSEQAEKNVSTALESILAQRISLRISPIPEQWLSEEAKAALEDTYKLFDAVDNAIVLHTYGPDLHRFEEKISNFDYSLGEEVKLLHGGTADALLFVRGVDHVSTGGRMAEQTATILVAAALGVMVFPQGGVTALSIALVDGHSGAILWQKFARSEGYHDLRDLGSTTRLLNGVLADFPLR